MCVYGGKKKGGNLVMRGLCLRFVMYGGPNEYRFVTVSLYQIMYQISV